MFIGASYFPGFADGGRWRGESAAILERGDPARRRYADGGNREQAFGYHLFVLAVLPAGRTRRPRGRGHAVPAGVLGGASSGCSSSPGALGEGGRRSRPRSATRTTATCSTSATPRRRARAARRRAPCSFRPRRLQALVGRVMRESARWLLGRDARDALRDAAADAARRRSASRAFPDAGYYLLQCGAPASADRISVLFDCGELGFGSIAAHGHADALSLTAARVRHGRPGGPGDLRLLHATRSGGATSAARAPTTRSRWTAATSRSMLGLVPVGRARAARAAWRSAGRRGRRGDAASTTATRAWPTRSSHRRTVAPGGRRPRRSRCWTRSTPSGWHRVAVRFHLAEHCRVAARDGNRFEIRVADRGVVVLDMDSRLAVEALTRQRGAHRGLGQPRLPRQGAVHDARRPRGVRRETPRSSAASRCCRRASGLRGDGRPPALAKPPGASGSRTTAQRPTRRLRCLAASARRFHAPRPARADPGAGLGRARRLAGSGRRRAARCRRTAPTSCSPARSTRTTGWPRTSRPLAALAALPPADASSRSYRCPASTKVEWVPPPAGCAALAGGTAARLLTFAGQALRHPTPRGGRVPPAAERPGRPAAGAPGRGARRSTSAAAAPPRCWTAACGARTGSSRLMETPDAVVERRLLRGRRPASTS